MNGVEFVSTMEAKALPFYGVQWHPEKNIWELGEDASGATYENIPHTPEAMEVTLHLTSFLASELRKNTHSFASQADETDALIWNYPIYFTQPTSGSFVQEYIADF